jgi:hypothetical protein
MTIKEEEFRKEIMNGAMAETKKEIVVIKGT